VLPAAGSGIFSAIMVGFGRAIGETMIVLMATGNTPVLDWSIFNGMRTLSANIAVEIPEAPYGGTLYRLLFFSGFLLFFSTFLINTVAEMIRQRLRSRYGNY
jgi:phosphate transport system permease protein